METAVILTALEWLARPRFTAWGLGTAFFLGGLFGSLLERLIY